MAMYQDKIETVDMRPKVKVRDLTPSRNSYSTVINTPGSIPYSPM